MSDRLQLRSLHQLCHSHLAFGAKGWLELQDRFVRTASSSIWTQVDLSGYLFFGFGLVGWIAIFFTVPEVAGRSYEEIDELFEAKTPTRQFATTKTRVQMQREEEEMGRVTQAA